MILGVSVGVVARRVTLQGPVLDRGLEPVMLRLIRLVVQILPPRRRPAVLLPLMLPQMLSVLLLPMLIVLLVLMLLVPLMPPCQRLRLLLNQTPWTGQRSTLLQVLRSWTPPHLRRYLLTIVITSWMSFRASPSFLPLPPPALTLTLWMGQPLTLALLPPLSGVPLLVV